MAAFRSWLLALAALLLAVHGPQQAEADSQADSTSLAQLAWHDGEIIFNGNLRKTVPPNGTSAADAVPCACSDAVPRDTSSMKAPYLVTTDCFFEAYYNNCNASFMQTYLAELVFDQGFCMASCGRCSCCTDVATLLKKLGANRFLQALDVAQPALTDLLSRPGWAGTLLVPTDAAFDAALADPATAAALRDPGVLQQVLKFHMLPPEPRTQGLWTTPFMAVGARMFTASDGNATIRSDRMALPPNATSDGGLTGLALHGPVNSARVVGPSDVGACKAYVTMVDAVLLPFDPATLPAATQGAAPAAALGAALGAPQCGLQANARINTTDVVRAGAANRQHTVGDCCANCASTPGCTAFEYCSQRGGCRFGDGSFEPFGACTLLGSDGVAAGQEPDWADWGATTPLISGYVVAPSAALKAAAGRRLAWGA